MSVMDLIGVLSLCLACISFGYQLGSHDKHTKNDRP